MNKKIFAVFGLVLFLGVVFVADLSTSLENSWQDGDMIELYLYEGWNLVGMYFVNEFGQEISDSLDYVYFMDNQEGEYVQIAPINEAENSNLDFSDDNNPLFNTGVWIYVSEDINASRPIYGQNVVSLEGFQLYEGWNVLSIVPEMIGKTVNDFKGDCNFLSLYFWGSMEQKWLLVDELIDQSDFSDQALAEGFIIKVEDDCNFGYGANGGVPSPPPIPSSGGNSNVLLDDPENYLITENIDSYSFSSYEGPKENEIYGLSLTQYSAFYSSSQAQVFVFQNEESALNFYSSQKEYLQGPEMEDEGDSEVFILQGTEVLYYLEEMNGGMDANIWATGNKVIQSMEPTSNINPLFEAYFAKYS